MIAVHPIAFPHVNISLFTPISKQVQAVDAKHKDPIRKFAALVEDVNGPETLANNHLYLTLYMKMPIVIFPLLSHIAGYDRIHVSVEVDGMNTHGIFSGSLATWGLFVLTDYSDSWVVLIQNAIRKILHDTQGNVAQSGGSLSIRKYHPNG